MSAKLHDRYMSDSYKRRSSRHPVDLAEPDHVGRREQPALNRPADHANLAPAGPRDSPCGGRRDGALTVFLRYRSVSPFGLSRRPAQRRASPDDLSTDPRVTREPPGALAERSGSERWPEQAAARPGRVGPA
jgi:hypothetical protein